MKTFNNEQKLMILNLGFKEINDVFYREFGVPYIPKGENRYLREIIIHVFCVEIDREKDIKWN